MRSEFSKDVGAAKFGFTSRSASSDAGTRHINAASSFLEPPPPPIQYPLQCPALTSPTRQSSTPPSTSSTLPRSTFAVSRFASFFCASPSDGLPSHVRGCRLGLAYLSAPGGSLYLENPLDPGQGRVPLLSLLGDLCRAVFVIASSWTIRSNSARSTSESQLPWRCGTKSVLNVPVALALWNQVGSESVLLIRTYAFFNRNIYVLWLLISALSGVVAYQIYVDSAQMLLLPFFKPPFDKGPCFPRSKPHSAHLLGFFVGSVPLILRHANRRQIAPLAFDTIVTAMTVVKAINIRRRNGSPNSRLIQTFLREGVFYYILISIANLINGIFYLQPRQVISALNIPLSVVLSPVIATRLILDLRERGSETVSHSEGTGIAAFTTKSMTQQSPFTPPHHRSKSALYTRNTTRTTDSNIVLSTLGSVMPELDAEVDISADTMDNLHHFGLMELGSLSTAVGGDDGEPIEKDEEHGDGGGSSPAPAYSLEMGFRAASRSPSMDSDVRGIRVTVDVERATSSI
uniref:Uncharacterized protein n=1 Tax=Mycena chlorophos TaxID=658473 RepID=A0ABQ0M288_MYCCL|nr:predicted protein [Mycena chlorophos]